jgi:hypothetical protein
VFGRKSYISVCFALSFCTFAFERLIGMDPLMRKSIGGVSQKGGVEVWQWLREIVALLAGAG